MSKKKKAEGLKSPEAVEAIEDKSLKQKMVNAAMVVAGWVEGKTGHQEAWSRTEAPKQVDFSNCHIEEEDLSGNTGVTTVIKNEDGTEKRTKRYPLQGIDWRDSTIEDVDFGGSDLRWSDFTGCDPELLKTCNWEGANLDGCKTASGKLIPNEAEHVWQ